eukprot:938135-Amphidinium_carterae.1
MRNTTCKLRSREALCLDATKILAIGSFSGILHTQENELSCCYLVCLEHGIETLERLASNTFCGDQRVPGLLTTACNHSPPAQTGRLQRGLSKEGAISRRSDWKTRNLGQRN